MPQYSKNFNWLQMYLRIQKEAGGFVFCRAGQEDIQFIISQIKDLGLLKEIKPQNKGSLFRKPRFNEFAGTRTKMFVTWRYG